MSLAPETQLGRYKIRGQIGAGGMGEVYRAHDPAINRDVAIKVLPSEFSNEQDRLRRFEQEAQAAGALNHPNILAIYDVATSNGSTYVVSELLEGETLRTILQSGPLSSRKVIDYGLQVAHGLAAAHDKGIAHRDVKPDNLFITKSGRVKILDFGIAKLIEPRAEDSERTELPTKKFSTGPGVAIGTVGYMSPEQVQGKSIDHRTDIFSFGCVLYEMISGRQAFRATHPVETLNSILKDDPADLSSITASISPGLNKLVHHCLEKEPEQRFQSAHDLAFALESLSGSTSFSSSEAIAPVKSDSRFRKTLPWTIAGIAVLSALLMALFSAFRHQVNDAGSVRFVITPPNGGSFQWIVSSSAVISPDGRSLILVITTEGRRQLWLRKLDSQTPQALAGTDNAKNPFWSPDSLNVGFFADGKLKRINMSGGSPQTVCDLPRPDASGTWSRNGTILISAQSIYRVTASGGDRLTVLEPDAARQEWDCAWPYFLPDGNHFLYVSMAAKNELRIGALDSKGVIDVMPVDSRVIYTNPGYLLFVKEGTLLAQVFDPGRLKISGEPIVVAEKLLYFEPIGFADISSSNNGVLVYQAGTNLSRLFWYSRDGAQLGEVGKPADYSWIRLSPDGQQAAVSIGDQRTGTTDIWLFDLIRGNSSRFTSDPGVEFGPVWSPDNKRIAFTANRGAPPFVQVKSLADVGSGESLNQPSGWPQFVWDWVKTSAGEFIIYGDGTPETNYDLLILPLSGDRKSRPFLNTRFNEEEARFSPDGKWIAYTSNESGRREVYVRPFEGGEKWQVSTAGGFSPRWRRDAKELYYMDPNGNLMSVVTKPGAVFATEIPKQLFHVEPAHDDYGQYDVTPDGNRFIVNVSGGNEALSITVALNWTSSLAR